MPLRKSFLILALLCMSLARLVTPSFAAIEFDLASSSTYTVSEAGNTSVTHEISLTNKLPDVYATEYAISAGSTRIQDAWAKDGTGFLDPSIQKTQNSTTISLIFKEKSVGVGQTLSFSIGYLDGDVAQRTGRIWEINIPRPEDANEFTTYDVRLEVPKEFKLPVQMTPEPDEKIHSETKTIFLFKKNTLLPRGITAIFGDKQVFSFDLRYTLENPSPIDKVSEIALPPDTAFQKLVYERLTPEPLNLRVDSDGNWLAAYNLSPGESLEIHAAGLATIFLSPQIEAVKTQPMLEEHLAPQPPWQTQDPQIRKLAEKLKTPELIYNYVVENLKYNYERVNKDNQRLGAIGVLAQPDQAICMEFTDLFIAIARAAGIPAKELNGFAFTQNPQLRPLSLQQDILHAWPEYFDAEKGTWIPVDPTWANTTQGIDYFTRFDLNHFVFAIHGISSNTPYPAGFYKIGGLEGKDIDVSPADVDPAIIQQIEVTLNLPSEIIAGYIETGSLTISNSGNAAIYAPNINIQAEGFAILSPSQESLPILLPYATHEIPIRVRGNDLLKQTPGRLQVVALGKTYETKLTINPIYARTPQYLLSLGMGAAFATAAARSRGLFLSLRKRRGALRWQSQQSKPENQFLQTESPRSKDEASPNQG